MEMARMHTDILRLISSDTGCPYRCSAVCMASLTSMAIDNNTRISCCSTENYDDCPMFLSRVLRSGKSG